MKKYLSIFLVFFLLFSFAVPAFAETTDVIPPNLDPTKYDSYFIYCHDDSLYLTYLYLSSDYDIVFDPNNRIVRLFPIVDSPHVIYHSSVNVSSYDPTSNNNGWGTVRPYSSAGQHTITNDDGTTITVWYLTGNFNFIDDYVIASSFDIPNAIWNKETKSLDYTGEFFFTLTPPLVVEVEKALILFQTQTIQTIMIILLCGVGCLALLISLPLLRKVLLRFLNR